MDKYISYLDSIVVDEELHERTMRRLRFKARSSRRSHVALRYVGIAACAIVLALSLYAVSGLLNDRHAYFLDKPSNPNDPYYSGAMVIPSDSDDPHFSGDMVFDQPYPFDPDNKTIAGLPVNNFSLADLDDYSGAMYSRIAQMNLSDFFLHHRPQFVFVRVIDTELQPNTDEKNPRTQVTQTSTVHILSVVWSETKLPVIMQVVQTEYRSSTDNDKTNFLRVGGVYLLPLLYSEYEETWRVMGDLDVLFEVDDQGCIWSHSQFAGFSQFDGKSAGDVVTVIQALTADENFSAAGTSFGYIVYYWGTLTEVTVLSTSLNTDIWGYDRVEYRLRVESIHSFSPFTGHLFSVRNGDEIRIATPSNVEYLEPGGRYLLLLDLAEIDYSGNGPYVKPERIARVNSDGTVTAIPTPGPPTSPTHFFTGLNGFTVEQVKATAERAKAWYAAYARR